LINAVCSLPLCYNVIISCVLALNYRNCEFLHKLDLTMNFVDVDTLEESIKHLQSRDRLTDMYMMGNPAQANWPNFANYVAAMLPQLVSLDGTEITKSTRIIARQHLAEYEVYNTHICIYAYLIYHHYASSPKPFLLPLTHSLTHSLAHSLSLYIYIYI
jgi:hypothetical protein